MPEANRFEPASGAEAVGEIVACAERTLVAPSACLEWQQEFRSRREWKLNSFVRSPGTRSRSSSPAVLGPMTCRQPPPPSGVRTDTVLSAKSVR
jgi:hypothetical protein